MKTDRKVYYDEEENLFTIIGIRKGDPIITSNSIKLANEEFDKALNLTNALKKFYCFKTTGSWLIN